MATKITEAFEATTNVIKTTINDRASAKYEEIKKQQESKLIDKSLIKKRNILEAEEKVLKEKLEDNEAKQEENKRLIEKSECSKSWKKLNKNTQEVLNVLHGLHQHQYNASATIIEVATCEEMIKTPEFSNLKQVRKLIRDVQNIYGLACGLKEQRNVILKLQNVNWKSLGIDLPYLDFMNPEFKIGIKDGEIITSGDRLLSGPTE